MLRPRRLQTRGKEGAEMFRGWAESGIMSWSGYINHRLPADAGQR